MESGDILDFKDAIEWRKWLKLNHNIENKAILYIYKKNSTIPGIDYDNALEEALCFGWIDGKMNSIDKDKFVLRFSPRKAKSVWSKINKDKAELLISQGKMTEAGLKKIEEAKKNGMWETAYTNKKRDKIPDDLESALFEDRLAWKNFHGFANSYRNMYIGWVINAKTEVTRRKRIAEVVKRASLNLKPGM